jgi:hypothetical protein
VERNSTEAFTEGEPGRKRKKGMETLFEESVLYFYSLRGLWTCRATYAIICMCICVVASLPVRQYAAGPLFILKTTSFLCSKLLAAD